MKDAARIYSSQARPPDTIRDIPQDFILATIHRAENTDNTERLKSIVRALNKVHTEVSVILPLHPRTRASIQNGGFDLKVNVVSPTGYCEMLWLLQHCKLVATDSGGLQKESYFHGKPCVTLRDSTEWSELVDVGANVLVGADEYRIVHEVRSRLGKKLSCDKKLYGDGYAAERITRVLEGENDE
jgi:UDP-GlcNAc3NAcA epimerase